MARHRLSEAKYQRCVYESIVGVNTQDGRLDEAARERIEKLRKDGRDCEEP